MSKISSDTTALEEYARTRSAEAFETLVSRHADWVYSAAARMVKDREQAKDVTQAVFLLLWQRPEKVRGKSLGGWLFRTVRYCAANALRAERRRAIHERRAAAMAMMDEERVWEEIAPRMEEIVGRLREKDRDVVLMRFYQGKSMGEIGGVLGISEEAARKRVSGAVEKLRGMLASGGVIASAAVLVSTLGARTTQAAPMELKMELGKGVASVKAISLAKGATQMMWMMKVKMAAAIVVAAMLAGVGGWMVVRAGEPAGRPLAANPITFVAEPVAMSAPATEGSLDLSTPGKAMETFCEGLREGDREKMYGCLAVDPKREPTEIDALLVWTLAENRMLKASREAFPGTAPPPGSVATLDVIGDFVRSPGNEKIVKEEISGEVASMRLEVTDDFLTNVPANMREGLKRWAGKPLSFKKTNDGWKFDIDRSMKMQLDIGDDAAGPDEARKRNIELLQGMTGALEEVTRKIKLGTFASYADARADLHAKDARLVREAGGRKFAVHLVPTETADTP